MGRVVNVDRGREVVGETAVRRGHASLQRIARELDAARPPGTHGAGTAIADDQVPKQLPPMVHYKGSCHDG